MTDKKEIPSNVPSTKRWRDTEQELAYEQGRQAFLDKESPGHNPYDEDSPYRKAWFRGWYDERDS